MQCNSILSLAILCDILVLYDCGYLPPANSNCGNDNQDGDLIVRLPEGRIQGHVLKSFHGSDYYAFQDIPYAAPPVGKNRFKEPKNPDPWQGILNTTENNKVCMQDDTYRFYNASEDCLYLNVYTPQKVRGSAAPLPVFVWFHGGGTVGAGAFIQTNPGFMMDYNIIVVTMNFRLGPFGTLTTMDGVIPGNLGLKDQRQALRWVHKNIHLFGGDPNKVTIGGESSGSVAVAIHLISQNSNGLFRAAIQASGSSLDRLVYTDKARQFAFQLGNILDKNINEHSSSKELLDVLQKSAASDILAAGLQVNDPENAGVGYLNSAPWASVIERYNDSEDPILTTYMYESYMNGHFHHVPLLAGYNSEESLFYLSEAVCPFGESYDADPSIMISRKLNIPAEYRREAGIKLKNIYTNTSFASDIAACVKYSSDVTFQNTMVRQAEVSSKYAPVYLYRFAYVGKLGDLFHPNGRLVIPGTESVSHGEDLGYTWQYVTNVTAADLLTLNRFQTIRSNFIKYLNPTPKRDQLLGNVQWPELRENNIQYLNINNTLEIMSDPRYYKQVKDLFVKYQRPPFICW